MRQIKLKKQHTNHSQIDSQKVIKFSKNQFKVVWRTTLKAKHRTNKRIDPHDQSSSILLDEQLKNQIVVPLDRPLTDNKNNMD